jgi:hypothetical protein
MENIYVPLMFNSYKGQLLKYFIFSFFPKTKLTVNNAEKRVCLQTTFVVSERTYKPSTNTPAQRVEKARTHRKQVLMPSTYDGPVILRPLQSVQQSRSNCYRTVTKY